jgi:hypothetical protein
MLGTGGYTCNLTRGRDQEGHSSKPAQENNSRDPISKKLLIKKGLAVWLKV